MTYVNLIYYCRPVLKHNLQQEHIHLHISVPAQHIASNAIVKHIQNNILIDI